MDKPPPPFNPVYMFGRDLAALLRSEDQNNLSQTTPFMKGAVDEFRNMEKLFMCHVFFDNQGKMSYIMRAEKAYHGPTITFETFARVKNKDFIRFCLMTFTPVNAAMPLFFATPIPVSDEFMLSTFLPQVFCRLGQDSELKIAHLGEKEAEIFKLMAKYVHGGQLHTEFLGPCSEEFLAQNFVKFASVSIKGLWTLRTKQTLINLLESDSKLDELTIDCRPSRASELRADLELFTAILNFWVKRQEKVGINAVLPHALSHDQLFRVLDSLKPVFRVQSCEGLILVTSQSGQQLKLQGDLPEPNKILREKNPGLSIETEKGYDFEANIDPYRRAMNQQPCSIS